MDSTKYNFNLKHAKIDRKPTKATKLKDCPRWGREYSAIQLPSLSISIIKVTFILSANVDWLANKCREDFNKTDRESYKTDT